MREKERIKRILKLIEKAWEERPNQRFGQLLINIGIVPDDLKLWNSDDDDLERYLTEYLKAKPKKDFFNSDNEVDKK